MKRFRERDYHHFGGLSVVAVGVFLLSASAWADEVTYVGRTAVVEAGRAPANCAPTNVKLAVSGDHYEYQDLFTGLRLAGTLRADGSFESMGTIGSYRPPITASVKGRVSGGRVEGTYSNSVACVKSFVLAP